MARLFVLGILLTGTGLNSMSAARYSDPGTHAAIDAYMKERMGALKIPGAALAIVQGDQIKYLQGYGAADSTGRAVTPQTPFMLASVSKSFTAVAVMQLVEEKKVDLDAPIQEYLPWFQIADKKAASEITIRHLLNQTSGFTETDGNRMNLNPSVADDALISSMRGLTSMELIHAPGAAFEYSNINYGLLGAIVETVSGQSFETYVQQNIFTPLDMKHSYTSLSDASLGGATHGYYPFFGVPVIYDRFMPYTRAVTSWAGIFSSAEDLAHYLIAHLNTGQYKNSTILSPGGMALLHSPGVQVDRWYGYAMGWWVGPNFDLASQDETDKLSSYTLPIAVFHEGSWSSFRTLAFMMPAEDLGVAVLMNTNDPAIDSVFGSIGWDVASIYLGSKPAYYPPAEDFIRQNARPIFIGVNILLLASLIWFIRKLRSLRHDSSAAKPRWRMILGYVVLPLTIDLFLAWFLLAKQLPEASSTVWVVLRMAPDIGLLVLLVLLFTLGWGAVRTLLVLMTIFRKA